MLQNTEQLEVNEEKILASYAVKSAKSHGRKCEEPKSTNRTCFQRDRDRIIHTKSWRRLKHKTQVFTALSGDHYRDRLTHSLEVAHIARDISRTLALNEDLAESIALAHDLGHPPFGHAGEAVLDQLIKEVTNNQQGFEHNRQSRRIVEEIEKIYPSFNGLNLSFEVVDGLIKHQSAYDQNEERFRIHPSLEAQVVNFADEIAYNCHDLDDAIRANLLTIPEIKKLTLWQMTEESLCKYYESIKQTCPDPTEYPQRFTGHLIHVYTHNLTSNTEQNIEKSQVKSVADIYEYPEYLVTVSNDFAEANKQLRTLLKERFYFSDAIKGRMDEGAVIITKLFKHFYHNPALLKDCIHATIDDEKALVDGLRDYISGMTDNFAKQMYNDLM